MMFTVFALKDSKPLTDEELAYLLRMLTAYALTPNGLWLQTLPLEKFNFRWCPAMNGKNGVIGCFSPLHPDTIFLQPFDGGDVAIKNPDGRVTWIERIFPTVVHELCHARQWKLSKIGYLICALPGLREITLEKDAKAAGKSASIFSEQWIAKQDYISASKRGLAEKIIEEDKEHENS